MYIEKFCLFCETKSLTYKIHISVFVLAAVVLLAPAGDFIEKLIFILGYYGILLIHEYGHYLFGIKTKNVATTIFIHPLGGMCYFEEVTTERAVIEISWGGIAFQTWLALIALIMTRVINSESKLYYYIYYIPWGINVVIILLNIIPLPFLDGGSMWKIFEFMKIRSPRIRKIKRPSIKKNGKKININDFTNEIINKAKKDFQNIHSK